MREAPISTMTEKSEERLSWIVAILASSYVGWTGYVLAHRARAFRTLFAGLGAELPAYTQVVLTVCTPVLVWPVTIAMIAVLLVKEAVVKRIPTRALVSIIVFMATACVAAVVVEALFQPMFQLIERIR